MGSLLKHRSRVELRKRSEKLRPDARPRWGTFTSPQMLSHVIQFLRMAASEVKIPRQEVPWYIRGTPFKQLLIHVVPFPKRQQTFPALLERPALDPATISEEQWAAELQEFQKAIRAVTTQAVKHRWPDHPVFGELTGEQWSTLAYRHVDYHFRQFGV